MKGTLQKSDKNGEYFTKIGREWRVLYKNRTRMKGTLQKSDTNEEYFTKIGQE